MITNELRRFAEVVLAIADNHTSVDDGLREAILTSFQLAWQGLPSEAQYAVTKFQGSPDTEQPRPPSRPVKRKADRFTALASKENDQLFSTAHNRPVVEAHAEVKPPERGLAKNRFIDTPKKKRRIDTNDSNFPPEEDINRWIQSPKDFFVDTGHESEGISRICRYLVRVEKFQNLNAIRQRFALRVFYLSRVSWRGYKLQAFKEKLGEDATSVCDSTFRAWVKEGYVYFLLGREFGLHILFLDVIGRRAAQRINLSPNVYSNSESDVQQQYKKDTEKCLSNLEFVDIGFPKETSPLFKSAAEAISKHLEQAQIDAGILKVSAQLDCQNGSSEGTGQSRTLRLHSPSEESPESLVGIQSRDASVDDEAIQQQDQTTMPISQDDTDAADLSPLQSPIPRVLEHENHGQASSQSPSQESAAHPTCPEVPLYDRSRLPPSSYEPNRTPEDRNPGTMNNSIDQHHLSHCSPSRLQVLAPQRQDRHHEASSHALRLASIAKTSVTTQSPQTLEAFHGAHQAEIVDAVGTCDALNLVNTPTAAPNIQPGGTGPSPDYISDLHNHGAVTRSCKTSLSSSGPSGQISSAITSAPNSSLGRNIFESPKRMPPPEGFPSPGFSLSERGNTMEPASHFTEPGGIDHQDENSSVPYMDMAEILEFDHTWAQYFRYDELMYNPSALES